MLHSFKCRPIFTLTVQSYEQNCIIDLNAARRRMAERVERFQGKAKKFCGWLENNFEEGLAFYKFPKSMWRKIRTVNIIESLNKEIGRRINALRVFPNEESDLRLITAVLADKHEE